MINPGQSKHVTLQGKTPPYVRNSDVVITANKYLARHCPSTMIVNFSKGRTQIIVSNATDKPVHFAKGRPIAFLDVGNLITVTQDLPTEQMFVTIKDTGNQNNTDANRIRTDNLRKRPHLDPDDPLATMSEDEILRRQIDLEQSIHVPCFGNIEEKYI